MDLFDLSTDEQLDGLPDEPVDAFIELSKIAYRSLRDRISQLNLDDERNSDWDEAKSARLAYMNVMSAAALQYDIAGLQDVEVASVGNYSTDSYEYFKGEVDRYVARLTFARSLRRRKGNVRMSDKVQNRLRQQVSAIRQTIAKENLPEEQTAKLFKRLDEFEREIEQRKLSLVLVARFTIELAMMPGALWATGDVMNRLVQNMLSAVGEAQAEEEAARALLSPEPMLALPSPTPPPARRTAAKQDFPMDDDIPF